MILRLSCLLVLYSLFLHFFECHPMKFHLYLFFLPCHLGYLLIEHCICVAFLSYPILLELVLLCKYFFLIVNNCIHLLGLKIWLFCLVAQHLKEFVISNLLLCLLLSKHVLNFLLLLHYCLKSLILLKSFPHFVHVLLIDIVTYRMNCFFVLRIVLHFDSFCILGNLLK